MIKQALRKIRNLIQGYDTPTYYFNPTGEDTLLFSIFGREIQNHKGFFIDVGAYHPYRYSNTFIFYKAGWRGINIEPRPNSGILFNKYRPDDINLEIGIANQNGWLEYHIFPDAGTGNSFDKNFAEKMSFSEKDGGSKVSVEVKRLDDVLENYPPPNNKIDFLTIDAEGMDLDVLK